MNGEPVTLTVSVGRREPSSFRLVATLAVAGMLAGLVLAGVYQWTKPIIEANQALELRRGVFKVVPDAGRLRMLVLRDGELTPAGGEQTTGLPQVYAAYAEDGRFLGYALTGAGAGFQDTIKVLFGYDPLQRRVTGMHILESRETPGLGDKIYKDADFLAEFRDLAVDPLIVAVKEGGAADNEVDAITGATISSQSVVRIINEARERWEPLLPQEAPTPPEVDGDQQAQEGR